MDELNNLEQPGPDWWDDLSEAQKENINEGIKRCEGRPHLVL